MKVDCPECGASLQLNPNLAGTSVSCPQCGGSVTVPEPRRQAPTRRAAATPAPTPAPEKRPMAPFTLWLLGAQAALAILGLSCLGGALFSGSWAPPEWSYFRLNPMFLIPAGVGLLVLGWVASYLPILASLLGAVFVMCACAHNYVVASEVDASRTLALMAAMFGVWCALQHRRAVA